MGRINCKTKKICIGDLKYRITLQQRSIKSAIDVDFSENYTDIASVWAHVEINNPKFIFNDINIDESVTHKFYIRYRSDIDINTWIFYDNIRYNIISIKPTDFDKKYLVLNCNIKGDSNKEASKW